MSLSNLQNSFIDGLYKKESSDLLANIKKSSIARVELFDIYRNNLQGALINALCITYGKIIKIIGDKEFKKLALEFIAKNRSFSGNLDDYGANFNDFLAIKGDVFLSDLAKLQWCELQSYLAKNSQEIDITTLQNLDSNQLFDLKFNINPSVFIIESNFNILAKKRPTKTLKNPANFIIYRQNFTVFAKKLTKNDISFIKGIKEGLGLYEIYEKYQIDIEKPLQKFLLTGVLIKK